MRKVKKKLEDVERFRMFTLTRRSNKCYYRSIYDVDLPTVILVKSAFKKNFYKIFPLDLTVYVIDDERA